MYDDEKYGIGSAEQFFGTIAPWAQEEDVPIYSNEGRNYTNPYASLLSSITGPGSESDFTVTDKGLIQDSAGNLGKFQDGSWVPYQGGDISGFLGNAGNGLDSLKKLYNTFKGFGSKALDFAQTPQGIMSLLAALAAYKDRAKPSGGGTSMAYAGPKPVTRTMMQGKYGPIAQYAAQGGLMQAYAESGHVKMEDGGFVLTKKAVDGAGGPQGLAALVPQARMIRGPGTGTSDSIPASIQGRSGVTPAKVSNGEAYVPRRAVQQAGGPQAMYALMNKLQRRA